MIKCGKCKGSHSTVTQVKACYGATDSTITVAVLNKPAPSGKTLPTMTDKQKKFILDLIKSRDTAKVVLAKDVLFRVLSNDELERAELPPQYEIALVDASHLIDELLSCPKLPDAQTPDGSWKTAVPKGRYAVELDGKLRFFFVRHNKGGYLRIREQAGPASYEKKFFEYKKIVEVILAAGIENAGKLYGQKLGQCWKCGLELTDPVSRALGKGPICRNK